ncbi:hypothetical protein QTN47_27700 [Danxiaibacter flavus]|uniref:Uncharacterized protein n=1 Tax=Danxiaibacter flavus TaxID=3049108 RepID=A0ABV3ZN64_9BACT|nr:hypothetical protein QNM32_27700 [Chitinophagaceae bacterium DXS]
MRFGAWLLFTLLAGFNYLQAQTFGGNPSSLKWKQIDTDTVRVIFPEGFDSTGIRIADITHKLQRNYSNTIGPSLRKVSIVLQKEGILSNGYVNLAPYRSEFYLMPPQNAFELGAQAWPDNLSIHEFRHVEQYSNFNRGLSKAASIIFGEEGQAVANSASIPNWFFEGDAVYNETLLSEQGRGRIPFFFNAYRSLYFGDKHYSYMKLRNGSYKNYVPDHYRLGYLLVAYGREKYGADFWAKVTHDAAGFKPLFYPLQGSVKKYSGVPFKEFVNNAFSFYKTQWQADKHADQHWLTPVASNNVVNYQYPYLTSDGKLVVFKSSYKRLPAFYLIDKNNNEQKIAVRDISYDDYFSYNNGKIIYEFWKPDVRWGYREYSNIKILDIQSGKEQILTSKKKYFSPDIAHDGKKVAAVEVLVDQSSSIMLMDDKGTNRQTVISSKQNIYSYPKFTADDRGLFYIERNPKGEMRIQKIDLSTLKITDVTSFTNTIIGFPIVKGDTLLYSISNKGKDELWAYSASSGAHYYMAGYPSGLYQGALDNSGNIYAATFTADGYRIGLYKAAWKKDEATALSVLYLNKPKNQEANELLETPGSNNFSIKKYSKATGLFNFHSWRPYYEQPEYSFSIYGENVLNTFQSELGYTYNTNEQSSKLAFSGIYGGWYVQPYLTVGQTWHRSAVYNKDTTFHWNEFTPQLGLQLPLNFSGQRHYTFLTLSSGINYNQVNWTGFSKDILNNYNFFYQSSRIIFSSRVQQVLQQIYPHWAQTVDVRYRNIVNKYSAMQMLAKADLYFPGLFPTHSLVINGAYQARDTTGDYYFSNDFPISRGYTDLDYPRMWKIGVNYHFPLVYPDLGIANIVYFQRIRLNPFYDYSEIRSLRTGTTYKLRSTGAELFFDTKWWNEQPVSFGIRYSRLIDGDLVGQGPNRWEFILPVNLLSH